MASITQRIKEIKQPRGGYVNPRSFTVTVLKDEATLGEQENIHASLVGLAVDYLTRFSLGASIDDAFQISFKGARNIGLTSTAFSLAHRIQGLDDRSITSACQLVGFDVCYRSSTANYRPVEDILPDRDTIDNIRTMVQRSLGFFDRYGPITKDGFTFEGAYTDIIDKGDGDYLTADTLWDLKVSRLRPSSKHTLQLLVYYLMGRRSLHKQFANIRRIGIYNPRLNTVYRLEIATLAKETIERVETEVIGY